MAVNKNFVVKNGLEVGTDLILANTTNSRVGIGTSLPTDTLHVNGGIAGTDFVISGIATIPTLNSTTGTITNLSATTISMGSTAVINSARQLQNIASLDDTTTATIEAAIEAGPNTFANLNISGISTFVGLATFGGGLAVQAGVSTFDAEVDINGGLLANNATIEDLTLGRVVVVGSLGRLEDDADLIWEKNTLTSTNLQVLGVTTTTGLLDVNGGVNVSGAATVDVLNVTGNSTLTSAVIGGVSTHNNGGIHVTGVVTATSFHGDISNTTGVSTNFTASVGIQSSGTAVGIGITTLNFIGAGNSISVNSGDTSIIDIEIAGGGGGAGAATSVGTAAPEDPELGQLWYNNEVARTFVYYDEVAIGIGASAYWVDSSPFDSDGQFLSKTGDNMTGALGIQTGSLAAPGLYINGSTNTGIAAFKPNEFSFTSAGTEKLNVNATGARIVGTTTVTGNINAVDGVFTGNVTVGGTLTKQDVTNVDSVGLITARAGIDVTGGGIDIAGTGALSLGTGTTIHAAANNELALGTNGVERVRIDDTGRVGIGTNNPHVTGLTVSGANARFQLISPTTGGGSGDGVIFGLNGDQDFFINNRETSKNILFFTEGSERLRITSGGDVSISSNGTVHGVSKLTILPADRTTAFDPSDGDTWHDVVLKQTGSATNNAVGICFETSTSGYHKNAGTGIAAVKNGTNSDYGSHLVFVTRPQSGAASEKLRISDAGALGIAGANYGTAGQVIKSGGGGASPAWGDSTIGISSGGLSIGSPTTLNFIGAGNTFAMNGTTVDISISGGGGGSGDFNTGLSGEFHGTAVGIGSTVFTFPSTAGKKYILRSLLATNVATANTDVNVIGAIDFNGGERSYIGYNLPVPVGMAAELLRQPQVLNPSDSILLRSTDILRNGVDSVIEYYGTYEEINGADYAGVGLGAGTLNDTSAKTLYTSTGAASVLQSIRVANISDAGAKPVSVSVDDGGETIRFVENLIVPKYGSIEILDNQKRIASGAIIKVTLDEGGTMGVQLSAKKIAAV